MRLRLIFILLAVITLGSFVPSALAEEPPACDPSAPGCQPASGPPPYIVNNVFGPIPVLAGASQNGMTYIDPLYSRVASQLSSVSNAQARCWNHDDWQVILSYIGGADGALGFVLSDLIFTPVDIGSVTEDKLHLSPDVCELLDALTYQRQRPQDFNTLADFSVSVAVLVHESMHVAGIEQESLAQCYAVQLIQEGAVRLGLPAAYSHRLSQAFWRYRQTTMPLAYQNPKCRDGSRLDLHPETHNWPS